MACGSKEAGWVAEHVCAEVPHRQFVFTIPKRLRIYFRFDRRLLGQLCRAAARTAITVYRTVSGRPDAVPGMVGAIQTFGQLIHAHPHIHTLVSEGVFLPDSTFLPLPKLATEPFLKLWESRDCGTAGRGQDHRGRGGQHALLEALRFQCGPERPLGGGRSARGPAPHPVEDHRLHRTAPD